MKRILIGIIALGACARTARVQTQADQRARSLERRADSLIHRFVTLPGAYRTVGDNADALFSDMRLSDDIVSLDIYAVPPLIACMSDERLTKVAIDAPHKGDASFASVGLLCNELLRETNFAIMRDTVVFRRAIADARVEGGVASDGDVGYWDANPDVLKRAQRVWQRYLALYRQRHLPSRPRIAMMALGCYTISVHRTKWDIAVIDTARRWYFELDTLPMPGTVRPDHIELAPGFVVGSGRSRWRTHYESAVYVDWIDSLHAFGVSIPYGDSTQHGFQLTDLSSQREIFGEAKVERVACRPH